MKRIKGIIFAGTFLLLCFLVHSAYAQELDNKSILFLNSYHSGYGWSDDIEKGLRDTFESTAYSKTAFFVEYMDTKRFYSDEYMKNLFDAYKTKYAGREIDLIVSSDDNAFNFLLKYGDELFPGVPIVFCGVNYFDSEKIAGKTNITGVNEEAGIKESVYTALSIQPETKKIIFVNDTTTTGGVLLEEINRLLPELKKNYQVEVFGNSPIYELLRDLKRENPNNTIIFYTLFFRDTRGEVFEVGDVLKKISTQTKIPIYGTWSFSLGYGIVGGYLTSGYNQGQKAGELALQILSGVDPRDIAVVMETPKEYLFDYTQIQKYGLDEEALPTGSVVINKPLSFYEQNKQMIYVFVISIIFLILIIILLLSLMFNRRQKLQLLNEYNESLEKEVRDRTESLSKVNTNLKEEVKEREQLQKNLEEKNTELENFNAIAVGREVKMLDLKKKLQLYEKKYGELE